MINKEELKEIARTKGLNLGYAEKDYLQDLILFIVSNNTKDEMVFKGGTCLYKFYNLDRFSEDLDFSLRKEINTDKLLKIIVRELKKFNIESKILEKKHLFNSISYSLRIYGPLYRGTPQSTCKLQIDVNLKSKVILEPVAKRLISMYRDVPTCFVILMEEEEILAEKIRAILTRDKARDLYDAGFLLEKGVKVKKSLLNEKLKYYEKIFKSSDLKESISRKEKLWDTELKPLVKKVPDFKDVSERILSELEKTKK